MQLSLDMEKAGVKHEPPDFSGCSQFAPHQQTAEAAAARKAVSPRPLHSPYVADLNGYRVTQDILRHPSGIPLPELVKPGTVVKTSYGTGPYIVKSVSRWEIYGVETHSLVCKSSEDSNGDSYLNNLVAVDGRILQLFLANEDEVFVLDDYPLRQKYLL